MNRNKATLTQILGVENRCKYYGSTPCSYKKCNGYAKCEHYSINESQQTKPLCEGYQTTDRAVRPLKALELKTGESKSQSPFAKDKTADNIHLRPKIKDSSMLLRHLSSRNYEGAI